MQTRKLHSQVDCYHFCDGITLMSHLVSLHWPSNLLVCFVFVLHYETRTQKLSLTHCVKASNHCTGSQDDMDYGGVSEAVQELQHGGGL